MDKAKPSMIKLLEELLAFVGNQNFYDRLIEAIGYAFDGDMCTFMLVNGEGVVTADTLNTIVPDDLRAAYNDHFAALNPIMKAAAPQLLQGESVRKSDVIHIPSFRETEYHQDFEKKAGWLWELGTIVSVGIGGIGVISVGRSAASSDFSDRQKQEMRRIRPAIGRIIELHRRLSDPAVDAQSAILLLDNEGRVKDLSETARSIMDETSWNALLSASTAARGLLSASILGSQHPVQLSSEKHTFFLTAVAATDTNPLSAGQAAHQILVCPYEPSTQDRIEGVRRRAGLSAREIQIALFLSRGYTPKTISEALGLSVHTVRTHLKGVRSKLACSRQSEIVAWTHRAFSSRNGIPHEQDSALPSLNDTAAYISATPRRR